MASVEVLGQQLTCATTYMQLGIAPVKNQSIYFAIAAAVAGVSGALGTTIGGFIAQFAESGGLLGLFALSSLFRLAALVLLNFVQEPGRGGGEGGTRIIYICTSPTPPIQRR